ncbi:MAG: xanthine dehydrogenase family protein subunit M [Deltaproteobacteria bacterium]|nr:xanthine dehydrogenase family protein subunit M [Deltaproteobacteria bacterium]
MRKVFIPETQAELFDIIACNPKSRMFAGGTDLLVKLRSGQFDSDDLVSLERIDELKGVEDYGDEVFIGACTTHSALIADPVIQMHFPVLVKALRVLGSPQIRNMGTIGGNIVTASPAGDTLPPLYLLEADLELKTKDSSRLVGIKDFIKGPGRNDLAPGEILARVRLRKCPAYNLQHYEKVGQRNSLAISIVSLAAVLNVSDKGIITEVRFSWGSAGPTVITCKEAEAVLAGRPVSNESLEKAARLARKAVKPIADVRASAEYRRQVSGNLILRIQGLLNGSGDSIQFAD